MSVKLCGKVAVVCYHVTGVQINCCAVCMIPYGVSLLQAVASTGRSVRAERLQPADEVLCEMPAEPFTPTA